MNVSKQSKSKDYCYLNTVWNTYNHASGMQNDFIDRMFEVLHYHLECSSKVFILRFDLHLPSYTSNNQCISQFQKQLYRHIDRQISKRNRTYKKALKHKTLLWAREQASSHAQHYHCVLLLDGQLFNHSKNIQQWVESLWEALTGGTVPNIKHPYYNLHRNDLMTRQKVIYRLSYLAKKAGKSNKGIRHFGSGQAKPMSHSSWQPNNNSKHPNDTLEQINNYQLGEEWLDHDEEPPINNNPALSVGTNTIPSHCHSQAQQERKFSPKNSARVNEPHEPRFKPP